MDSITHIVLGATIGEAIAGRRLGKKAMLIGAIAQSLPDIDFIASFWLDTSSDVLAHRGITHSLLFVVMMSLLLAWVCRKVYSSARMSFRKWWFFLGLELLVHIVLDAFNAYGTGWFEPFSHYRVSFHALFVADPLFSVWPGIAFLALLWMRRDNPRRRFWVGLGLGACSLYLCYCLFNKLRTDELTRAELHRQGIVYTRYFTTPTILNSWLWYIVAEDSAGYHIGYSSVFDKGGQIQFDYFPRNDSLLAPFRGQEDVRRLLRFSEGYYTVGRWKDELVFNDLRFGLIRGWEGGKKDFVFHYFLQRPGGNEVIVQRGRFSGWNLQTFWSFHRRVWGSRR